MFKDGFYEGKIALFLFDVALNFGTNQNLKPQPRFKTEGRRKKEKAKNQKSKEKKKGT